MGNAYVKFVLLSQTAPGYMPWYNTVVERFAHRPDVVALSNEVGRLKSGKDTPAGLMAYRDAKSDLQERWLDFYEDELVQLTERAVSEAKRPGVDLYVVAMPEFQIHDYEPMSPTKKREPNYANPIYEETVRSFTGVPLCKTGQMRDRRYTDRPARTFIDFTRANPDVVLFAGSVWWKQWKVSFPKGIIFNSAVVFYQGRCRMMWDKQFISGLDGMSEQNSYSQWLRGRYELMLAEGWPADARIKDKFTNQHEMNEAFFFVDEDMKAYIIKYHRGILSDLSKQFNFFCIPYMDLDVQGKGTLHFSLDICYDANNCPVLPEMPLSRWFQEYEVTVGPESDGKRIMVERAQIQMVIAADVRKPGEYAKAIFCCCDAKHEARIHKEKEADVHLVDVCGGLFVTSGIMEIKF